MEIQTINEILAKSLTEYDESLISIKHCLSAYERKCEEIISDISASHSVLDAESKFDTLLDIQTRLSGLLFGREIRMSKKLEDLVRNFDRLDDQHSREYWFNKFKSDQDWPHSV